MQTLHHRDLNEGDLASRGIHTDNGLSEHLQAKQTQQILDWVEESVTRQVEKKESATTS